MKRPYPVLTWRDNKGNIVAVQYSDGTTVTPKGDHMKTAPEIQDELDMSFEIKPKKWDDIKKQPSRSDMCSCLDPSPKENIISASVKFWYCTDCKKECTAPVIIDDNPGDPHVY